MGHTSSVDAIGAEVHLTSVHTGTQLWTVSTAGSYLSSNDKRAHFGLGPDAAATTVTILWPSGIRQTLSNVAADEILTVQEPNR